MRPTRLKTLIAAALLLPGLAALPALAAEPADPAFCRPTTVKAARRTLSERFAEANITHDGKLTEAQAQSIKSIAKNFTAIDHARKGYVTYDEIHAWQLARRAVTAQARADAAARSLRS